MCSCSRALRATTNNPCWHAPCMLTVEASIPAHRIALVRCSSNTTSVLAPAQVASRRSWFLLGSHAIIVYTKAAPAAMLFVLPKHTLNLCLSREWPCCTTYLQRILLLRERVVEAVLQAGLYGPKQRRVRLMRLVVPVCFVSTVQHHHCAWRSSMYYMFKKTLSYVYVYVL